MITVRYKPSFLRQYKKLPDLLKDEVKEKIGLFKSNPDHHSLKTHKLKGHLKGCWSFSVNFAYQIVFFYEDKNTVALLSVGNHDVYR